MLTCLEADGSSMVVVEMVRIGEGEKVVRGGEGRGKERR